MKLSSVLFKTPKGLEEISTRANRLPSRVRAMLIMVDGHRTGDELVALSSSSAEGKRHLAALLNGGFIQVQSPPGSSAEQAAEARPALPDEDISLARSYAARTLMDLLGAQAGALVAEIERAKTRDELQRQLVKLRAALGSAPDQKAAQQFLEKLVLVLD
jgi:hypothetical protein